MTILVGIKMSWKNKFIKIQVGDVIEFLGFNEYFLHEDYPFAIIGEKYRITKIEKKSGDYWYYVKIGDNEIRLFKDEIKRI
jgi:hypothetical protein